MTGRPRGRSLVVATQNRHKLEELEGILIGFELLPLPGHVSLPPEDGETFIDNALGKARATYEQTASAVIADDSGISAVALGGRPGVRSARFAGPQASDAENLNLLFEELRDASDRSVSYVCAIAHIDEDGIETVREAHCDGQLAREPRGDGGFGYDPGFLPDDIDDDRTMAELNSSEKHAISHRGRAAREIADAIGAAR